MDGSCCFTSSLVGTEGPWEGSTALLQARREGRHGSKGGSELEGFICHKLTDITVPL